MLIVSTLMQNEPFGETVTVSVYKHEDGVLRPTRI